MRTARVLLALPGLAALAWGLVLFGEFALPLGPTSLTTLGWLVAGPVLHDGLLAPVVAVLALVLTRLVPRHWRAPLLTGAAVTGVLALLSIPLLWREYGAAPSPGLHDRDVLPGLLVALAVVWVVVLAAGVWQAVRARRATSGAH